MTFDVAAVLRDAWAMAKRDREILIAVAGVFILAPAVAQAMFVTSPPAIPAAGADQAAMQAWLNAAAIWSRQNDLLLIVLAVLSLFGTLAIFMLYGDQQRPDVATALKKALPLLPRFVLLALIVTLPVNIATLLLLLPGLYLKGRLFLVGPAFVAERPLSALAAWRRSFALTRRRGLVMMAFACVPILGGEILSLPFDLAARAMDGAPMANLAVAAVLDLGSGAAHAVSVVAAILLEVALYRRLSSGT